jgi:hypothetical protein
MTMARAVTTTNTEPAALRRQRQSRILSVRWMFPSCCTCSVPMEQCELDVLKT